jgi:hypothetical protein
MISIEDRGDDRETRTMNIRLRRFLEEDDGAVATDWVVITAAVAGLGLATMVVVAGGVEDLSGEIQASLVMQDIVTAFDTAFEAIELSFNDFSGGDAGDWVGARVTDLGGALGEALQIGAGERAEVSIDVPPGAKQVALTFDLLGIDSLDNETATITLNGETISVATGNHGSISFANSDIPGISVGTEIQVQNQQLGGSNVDQWRESVSTVTILVDNPGPSITLGVASGTNQGRNDESYGIDNFTVNAL